MMANIVESFGGWRWSMRPTDIDKVQSLDLSERDVAAFISKNARIGSDEEFLCYRESNEKSFSSSMATIFPNPIFPASNPLLPRRHRCFCYYVPRVA